MQNKIAELESSIVECNRAVEIIMKLRTDLYNEINDHLEVIERNRNRYEAQLGVLYKAKLIVDDPCDTSKNAWRENVLMRDHYTCRRCGARIDLTCHHIVPKAIENDHTWDTSNGITLCQTCHNEWHKTHDNSASLNVFIKWLQNN